MDLVHATFDFDFIKITSISYIFFNYYFLEFTFLLNIYYRLITCKNSHTISCNLLLNLYGYLFNMFNNSKNYKISL